MKERSGREAADRAMLFAEPEPQPLRWGDQVVHIGTSGFSFDDWRGVFYPEGLGKGDYLRFYARHFSAVEINSTYYRLPPSATFARMGERTPEHFRFWVKTPKEITHRWDPVAPVMAGFRQAVQPLAQIGKLSGILAQFPASFRPTSAALERLAQVRAASPELPVAVEIRHREWQTPEMVEWFRRAGIIWAAADLPALPELPAPLVPVTAETAYLRFHGRNAGAWTVPRQGERYNYEYSEGELREWAHRLTRLERPVTGMFIFFNNCHAGQAVRNARMLRNLLETELNLAPR